MKRERGGRRGKSGEGGESVFQATVCDFMAFLKPFRDSSIAPLNSARRNLPGGEVWAFREASLTAFDEICWLTLLGHYGEVA